MAFEQAEGSPLRLQRHRRGVEFSERVELSDCRDPTQATEDQAARLWSFKWKLQPWGSPHWQAPCPESRTREQSAQRSDSHNWGGRGTLGGRQASLVNTLPPPSSSTTKNILLVHYRSKYLYFHINVFHLLINARYIMLLNVLYQNKWGRKHTHLAQTPNCIRDQPENELLIRNG